MKNRLRLWLALVACSALACENGQTGSAAPRGEAAPDGGPHGGMAAPDGGPFGGTASGSGGSQGGGSDTSGGEFGQCKRAADCMDEAQYLVETLAHPQPSRFMVTGASCENLSTQLDDGTSVSGTACMCEVDGGRLPIGPVGAGCFWYGRAGDCLWDDSEFDGCEVDAPGTLCDDLCAELEQRVLDDAKRTFTDARVVYTACEEAHCADVIEVEGRCYANHSFSSGSSGRAYDCELGGEEILKRYGEGQDGSGGTALPEQASPYAEGTNGFIDLIASTSFEAGTLVSSGFGAEAQLMETIEGEVTLSGDVIDPLEGIDDCGVSISSGMGSGTGGPHQYIDIGELVLTDDGHDHAFELSSASGDSFKQYVIDLSAAGVKPRYGGSYMVSGGGGTFGETIAIEDLELPEALEVESLADVARVQPGALRLSWSGRGDAPLRIGLSLDAQLGSGVFKPYAIECVVEDDGEFEIPASVLEAAPEGVYFADFRREWRKRATVGKRSVTVLGAVDTVHHFALGKACDQQEVLDACKRAATKIFAEYEKCDVEPPKLEAQCPAYLAEACTGCSEYFDCQAESTRCTDQGLTVNASCTCPTR